jgi:phosphopantetheinyl transferase
MMMVRRFYAYLRNLRSQNPDMPIIKFSKISKNSFWCMWEITETVDELKHKVVLSDMGIQEMARIHHAIKQKERMASRACVQELVRAFKKDYKGLFKDEHDKPFLIDLNWHISISHSFPYAVAIIHKKLPVGIDIEKPIDKLVKLAPRFLGPEEIDDAGDDPVKLCVYWTGKEAIFKLNGKRGLNFRRDIRIHPFKLVKRNVIRSEFTLNDRAVRLSLDYRELKNHIISYCI